MRFLSLFSGIEAASSAWLPLGWACVGFAEIEPFPCSVLQARHPGVPNLGDVTQITEQDIFALGHIDIVIFGSPCQDLSIAGKRAGLAGDRSGLFFDAVRIVQWARQHGGLRFALWENVPGAFSSNRGADFAYVVGELAGGGVPAVPPNRWGTEGAFVGSQAMVEWSTLDAQWFGVAQQRRRVFALADFGNWKDRPPILLEPDSLRGDSAPSREAGQGSTAGVIKGAAIGRQPHNRPQYGDAIADDSCYTLTTNEVHAVAHTLRGEGFDASEDGTGRGTPLVPVAVDTYNGVLAGEVAATLATGGGGVKSGPSVMVPVGVTIHGTDGTQQVATLTDVSSSLRARTPSGVENSTTTVVLQPVAFDTTQITSAANRSNPKPGDPCHPLAAGAHAPAVAFMADDYKDGGYEEADTSRPLTTSADRTRAAPIVISVSLRGREGGGTAELGGEVQTCLRASSGGGDKPHVLTSMGVRRLTPVECERLQGFPDNWTAIPWRGKPADQCPDGPRYKALGNSMAVPVIRWIGEAIEVARLFQE